MELSVTLSWSNKTFSLPVVKLTLQHAVYKGTNVLYNYYIHYYNLGNCEVITGHVRVKGDVCCQWIIWIYSVLGIDTD